MLVDFHNLEENLKEFLCNEQKDAHNTSPNNYKYNNLKLSINNKKYEKPHFIVTLGISEAAFSIADCERIDGGLGPEERYIYRWFDRMYIQDELKELWKKSLKFSPVNLNELKNQ